MWLIHGLQGLLIVAVCWLVCERVRELLYRAPAGERYLGALQRACAENDRRAALSISKRVAPAWCAEVARAGLEVEAGGRASQAMEEELLEVRFRAAQRLRALRILATVASTLGLMGAVAALVRGFGGDGLLSLQAGLAESVALRRALLSMAVGVGTSAVCFYAVGLLRRAAWRTISQATRAARAVEGLGAH